MLTATQIRVGHLIEVDGKVYRVLQMDHVTPGKGRGHVQVKMRDIADGTSRTQRFRSDEKVSKIHLEQRSMEYLYDEGERLTFMDSESFEQISLSKDLLGEAAGFLTANAQVAVNFHEDKAVGIELPVAVDLKVVSAGAVLKGATATAQYKPATLETGIDIQVPTFIKTGDIIRVEVATGKYLERVRSA